MAINAVVRVNVAPLDTLFNSKSHSLAFFSAFALCDCQIDVYNDIFVIVFR